MFDQGFEPQVSVTLSCAYDPCAHYTRQTRLGHSVELSLLLPST
jgi:hypothetical protein